MDENRNENGADESTKIVRRITRAKLNLEVIAYSDDTGHSGILVRCRPYAKAKMSGGMLVGFGADLATALKAADDAVREGDWVELDWAWRPGDYIAPSTHIESVPEARAFKKAGGR